MSDDVVEFVELTELYKSDERDPVRQLNDLMKELQVSPSNGNKDSGQPVQYSKYRNGYVASTETIKSLPAGCYEVRADSNCTFVVPALNPSGLLLELPEMRSDHVIKLVETFWNSEKDYKEGNEFVHGGAAYKAGIMLYGPPGSGKSCTIKIVSKKLVERGGIVFYANGHPAALSDFLSSFARVENSRKSIVIFEDIDSLIEQYGEAVYLELLDSAKTIDNVLFIATTNYPEKLDPRIYNRPGRFSHVVKVGLPGKAAREAYLKAILKNYKDVPYIVDQSDGFTIDHLTSLISGVYREKKDLHEELDRLRKLFKIPKVKDDEIGISFTKKVED